VVVAICLVLVSRLGWLQLVRGRFYRGLSEDNYVQGFLMPAPRGLILDRNGEILVYNRTSLSITLTRMKQRDDALLTYRLSDLLDLESDFVAEKLKEASRRFYGNVVLIKDANLEQVSRVEERRSELPGVKVEVTAVRRYPVASLATHAIGYVAEISDSELKGMASLGYRSGNVVGKTGVEDRYEFMLRGRDGAEYWVCDAVGRELYPFQDGPSRTARPGSNLVLSLDAPAQIAAEEALSRYDAGAIVAIAPQSGEVLVLASSPAPNPNDLVDGISNEEWATLSTSPFHPLLNRAIQATYPPGSVFKLITAAAGLESRSIARNETVTCVGAFKYGIRTFRCWKHEGHGVVDMMKGIVESCDVYFYQLGVRLGVAQLMDWADKSGIGHKIGIDIAGEARGNLPTPAWYDRTYGKRKWSRGVVLNLAIGQGELLATPLQMACVVCGIVNDGHVYAPHVLKRIETYSGRVIGTVKESVSYELPFSHSTLSFLRQAMVNVVEAPNGTAKLARVPGIQVGGKTGTAQNPHGEDHAWFVCFAPADDPEIVVAVLVEHGGGGGAIAAPIAREVVKAYLRLDDPEPGESLEPHVTETDHLVPLTDTAVRGIQEE
jgi:penicillin-binding protein 2